MSASKLPRRGPHPYRSPREDGEPLRGSQGWINGTGNEWIWARGGSEHWDVQHTGRSRSARGKRRYTNVGLDGHIHHGPCSFGHQCPCPNDCPRNDNESDDDDE
jgi:hypothetical protein